jgi:hypothetical protein
VNTDPRIRKKVTSSEVAVSSFSTQGEMMYVFGMTLLVKLLRSLVFTKSGKVMITLRQATHFSEQMKKNVECDVRRLTKCDVEWAFYGEYDSSDGDDASMMLILLRDYARKDGVVHLGSCFGFGNMRRWEGPCGDVTMLVDLVACIRRFPGVTQVTSRGSFLEQLPLTCILTPQECRYYLPVLTLPPEQTVPVIEGLEWLKSGE